MCLKEKGDVAFLNEKTVFRNADNPEDFELLCPIDDDPSGALERRPVTDYERCSWGVAPGRAVVVSSAIDMPERLAIQSFLQNAFKKYGGVSTGTEQGKKTCFTREGHQAEFPIQFCKKAFHNSFFRYLVCRNLSVNYTK